MNVDQLNEAFQTFTAASKSLEASYSLLKERVAYLTSELEIRNTQLRDALADAEQHKEYLRAILHNLDEAIVVADPSGIVTMMNRSAERLLGVRAEDIAGKPFSAVDATIGEEGTDTILIAGGKRYSVLVSHSDVVDARNNVHGRVLLFTDVTRIRELELRHERNQRLIAMGEMAAKLVHEIRNPLCSIELFSSMLEKELTTTVHKDLAHGISTGIANLNTILTNMLFFARPSRPSLKAMRLDSVVEESLRMIEPMIASRQVVLTRALNACELTADAELLRQVLLNILLNAVQSMPGGGFLDVRMEQDGDVTAVSIKDTGTGIPRENLEKIFDPFFTTKDSGTGLGLVIASNIMQSIGGYITVASEPGSGSTFRLCFPLRQEQRLPQAHAGQTAGFGCADKAAA